MKCPKCGGSGWDVVHGFDCVSCDGKGEITLTNEEYIRTCSTEELVNIIVCELRNTDLHNMKLKYNLFNGNDFDAVRVWLKEKHNEML